MIHITLTGPYAGTPYCGRVKSQLADQGDEFMHAQPQALANPEFRARICPDCLYLWDDAGEDDQQ